MSAVEGFDRNVFINCPFSSDYQEYLRAMIFVIHRLGFNAFVASQESDSGELRMMRIKRLIHECRHSIHDLSINVSTRKGQPARMNMPFELGLDLGARWYGVAPLDQKLTLVLEKARGSVRNALSDHAGFEIVSYEGSVDTLIQRIRSHFYSFLAPRAKRLSSSFPTHEELCDQRLTFLGWLHSKPKGGFRSIEEIQSMEVAEYRDKVVEWLEAQNQSA